MLSFLRLKDIDKYDLDDPRRTIHHKEIIKSKPFLNELYINWYSRIKDLCDDAPEGRIIELGSGGGFLKEVFPEIETSDILELPDNDHTFNALNMPFEDGSLSAIVMVDVFHHVPDSEKFISEMNRCLKPGGLIVMSEPCTTWWSKIIFKNFHHEPFNEKGDWTIPGTGPMSDANGALPWIVLNRDQKRFKTTFPKLEIEKIKLHSPMSYMLSGGVSMKQLVPSWSYKPILAIEKLMTSIVPGFAMFQFIKIRKV
ncbi:class I SAM-dependent methyltransferase [bacterium]|nr:class I SAM-dependent methyltransferase [bacterium]